MSSYLTNHERMHIRALMNARRHKRAKLQAHLAPYQRENPIRGNKAIWTWVYFSTAHTEVLVLLGTQGAGGMRKHRKEAAADLLHSTWGVTGKQRKLTKPPLLHTKKAAPVWLLLTPFSPDFIRPFPFNRKQSYTFLTTLYIFIQY